MFFMHAEVELKLSLSPDDCVHLHHLPILETLSHSRAETLNLYTIYYDTPNLDLKTHRIALRLRRLNNRWTQTIKGKGQITSGLHQQYEWETPVNNAQPDYAKITDPDLIKLFDDKNIRQQIQPIFVTQFTRHVRLLYIDDGSKIEYCLDQGTITAGHSSMPLCEIELELKSGDPSALFQFALTLQRAVPFPLKLENINKAERGYTLHAQE